MRVSPTARCVVLALVGVCVASTYRAYAQQNSQASPVTARPTSPSAAPQALPQQSSSAPQAAQTKKPATAAPAGPQSTHYPILLLAQGSDQSWSLRIGLKGPERLDRNGYPPIPLEPAEVTREGTTDAWTYHAKDSQTGAAVAVHITRGGCADSASGTKWAFTASVEHAQIGTSEGCARVATELFPKINNQPTDDDDTKDKPTPPTVTKFKPPVAVAYVNAAGRLIMKRGTVARAIPGKGYQPAVSHDGKKLLFTVDQSANERTISVYEWTSGKVTELLRGAVQQPFWSPDDSLIAFLKSDGASWQAWVAPAEAPDRAALASPSAAVSLQGWTDTQTILADDLQKLSWISEDGTVKETLSDTDVYGKDQFRPSSANTTRIHPLNSDLLLVSGELTQPLPVAGAKGAVPGNKDAGAAAHAFFLYEIRSKRRVLLSPPNLSCSLAEWSRDGLQIFFTCGESGATATVYRMFWDGTSQIKVVDGYDFVIGQ